MRTELVKMCDNLDIMRREIVDDANGTGAQAVASLLGYVRAQTAAVDALKAEVDRLTPREMTLVQACCVLNQFEHLGLSDWTAKADAADDDGVVSSEYGFTLTAFETTAVAEKLHRDAKGGG